MASRGLGLITLLAVRCSDGSRAWHIIFYRPHSVGLKWRDVKDGGPYTIYGAGRQLYLYSL